MTVLLGVNIDHIATVRQARGTLYPDILQAALEAEAGGADGITVHLREDRRHIQPQDVELLKEKIHTRLNLEMAVTPAMITFAQQIRPAFCCLVPERREELTTEGGLDVKGQLPKVRKACQQLAVVGIQVSLFIDPDATQIDAAAQCGAPYIEIHTGEYADAIAAHERQQHLQRIRRAVSYAQQTGLKVNAGHGLNYTNVQPVAAISGLVELNIGHAIVAQALFCGMRQAVTDMKKLLLTDDKL